MAWTVHYFDKRLNSEEVSRPFPSEEDALRHAAIWKGGIALLITSAVPMGNAFYLLLLPRGADNIKPPEPHVMPSAAHS